MKILCIIFVLLLCLCSCLSEGHVCPSWTDDKTVKKWKYIRWRHGELVARHPSRKQMDRFTRYIKTTQTNHMSDDCIRDAGISYDNILLDMKKLGIPLTRPEVVERGDSLWQVISIGIFLTWIISMLAACGTPKR